MVEARGWQCVGGWALAAAARPAEQAVGPIVRPRLGWVPGGNDHGGGGDGGGDGGGPVPAAGMGTVAAGLVLAAATDQLSRTRTRTTTSQCSITSPARTTFKEF
jgi:hypothetical protein